MRRLIFATLLATATGLVAQDASPTPEPTPATAPEAASTPAEVAAEPSPTGDASTPPAAGVATGPAPTTPGEDTIALPGDASAGEAPIVGEGEVAPVPPQPVGDSDFIGETLIPSDTPDTGGAPATAQPSKDEVERKEKVRYTDVRAQVEKDPAVRSLKAKADKATSAEDQRAALREYYRLLFKKMVSVDASLRERCRLMEQAYLRRLAQNRVEPTIPLNPPPQPEPLAQE